MNILASLGAIWFSASIGYYYIIPIFGFTLSYNSDPLVTSLYYLSFSLLVIFIFQKTFLKYLKFDARLFFYAFILIVMTALVATFLYSFFSLEQLYPPIFVHNYSSYADILLANKWYFFPKIFEVLFQDLLVTILIIELGKRFSTLKQVQMVYASLFGGAHVVQLYFSNTENLYSVTLLAGALLSTFIFPRLILRTKGGFEYLFVIHFLFYVFLAIFVHQYPPDGYFIFSL